jgi:hypothetical protein
VGVSGDRLRAIAALVAEHRGLDDVVRSGLLRTPSIRIAEVVKQDELTHDVIVPHDEGLVLVYDTT